MTDSIGAVLCGACNRALEERPDVLPSDRTPCATCGSTTRVFNDEVRETLTVSEKRKLRHRRPGNKKPIYEEVSGDDLHRKTGRWSILLRVIDRQNDRYREHIVDAASGEVLRSVDEPLRNHKGRGTAKAKA